MRRMSHIRQKLIRLLPRAIILCYHRVNSLPADPNLLSVTPAHFLEHLNVLRRYYHPLSLSNLIHRHKFNVWPAKSVVITFDDGYADNATCARPLLEAADIPATVFVTAGPIGNTKGLLWWDELGKLLLSTSSLPAQLSVRINGQECCLTFRKDDPPDPKRPVNLESESGSRQHAYQELKSLLRVLPTDAREKIISDLYLWAGNNMSDSRPDYRTMNAEELRSLACDGLIEVGAHTMTHPVLSALPLEAQRDEILESKRALENILEQPVNSFAYPYGARRDYTSETASLVKEAGFRCACSCFSGRIILTSDPYQLPRYCVPDCNGDGFAQHLRRWFGD